MYSTCKRLSHTGFPERDARGDSVDTAVMKQATRDRDEFRKRPWKLPTERCVVATDRTVSSATDIARPADQARGNDDGVSRPISSDLRSDRFHDARNFMADDMARQCFSPQGMHGLDTLMPAERPDIRPTDATRANAEE